MWSNPTIFHWGKYIEKNTEKERKKKRKQVY